MATYTLTADAGRLALEGQAAGLTTHRLLTATVGTLEMTGPAVSLLARRLLTGAVGSLQLFAPDVPLRAPSFGITEETGSMRPRIAVIALESLAEIRSFRVSTSTGPQVVLRLLPDLSFAVYRWTQDVDATDDTDLILVPTRLPRLGCWKRMSVSGGGP